MQTQLYTQSASYTGQSQQADSTKRLSNQSFCMLIGNEQCTTNVDQFKDLAVAVNVSPQYSDEPVWP